MKSNVHHLLSAQARVRPDAAALTYQGVTYSYDATWRAASAFSADLRTMGIQTGDRVAIYLEKCVEFVASIFGTSAAGGVFVPINHVLKSAQVGHILMDSGARILVTSVSRLAQLETALSQSAVEHVVIVGDGAVKESSEFRRHRWPRDHAVPESAPQSPVIDIDPAAILYTSGSTGRPKGVVLSHRNLIVGAESVSSYLRNTDEDVILSVLPLSFDAGLSQVTTAFAVGAHCILMNYLLPRDVVRLCEEHGVTGVTCVPPLWHQLVAVPWPDETAARLRYWANTGGRMPRTTLDALRATFVRADSYLMYGLTEAFRSTYLDPTEVDRRPDSIGKAIPNAEVLVLRPDATECLPGEPGELVHRGALVALGYWNDPVRTAERFRPLPRAEGSWRPNEIAVWSGDTVVADEEGFLSFVGRRDDMIKTSGYRVSPTEIEEAAYGTGLVGEAVAVGVDDAVLGQRVVLVVAPTGADLQAEALAAALRPVLPSYMLPSRIYVREELPRSPNGKFDRPLIALEVHT